MAEKLSAVLPYPVVYKVTAKTNDEITNVVKEANYDDNCAGIIPWASATGRTRPVWCSRARRVPPLW